MIPYGKQSIDDSDIKSVIEALQSPLITQGPYVERFEEAFAAYIGSKYAVAVSNGTAALHLSCLALGVNNSSRVITSPITFAASANCVRYCGGEVAFADIDPGAVLIDVENVRDILNSAPKGTFDGIIPVDFAGYPVNLESFRELADEYGLWILEDACHAPGGYFQDSKGIQQYCGNGQYADLAIFSFHPVKHIACGEGGMVTTNDQSLYEKLLLLRTHGITKQEELIGSPDGGWYYDMVALGYNYRLTDIQCALGLSQLNRADQGLERRREIASRYNIAFRGTQVGFIEPPDSVGHAYHLYVVLLNNRKEVYDKLREADIYAQVHYIPVHTLQFYRDSATDTPSCPHAEAYYEKCLSLPMYPALSDEEQDYVIEKVLEFASNG